MARIRRITLCSALGGAVGLGGGAALADEAFVFSPGLTFSADSRGDGGRRALGVEMTANSVSGKALAGFGLLFQLDFDFDGGVRTVLGGQGFYSGVGLEGGVGWYRPPEGPVVGEVQIAPFLSVGYASVAARLLLSEQGADGGVALALKYPIHGDGVVPLSNGCGDVEPEDGAVCGRPLRGADDRPWRAPVLLGGPMRRGALAAAADGLDPTERRRLAAAWLSDARDEHAAIAAFRQLAADLRAYDAPRPLIAGALRSAADEVGHARRAFAIASALAGRRLRPLPMSPPVRPLPSRAELAAESWLDGAMNEGRAAAEARVAQRTARVPAVRRLLADIGREEARHAALGAAVAEWAAGQGAVARAALVRAKDIRSQVGRPATARDQAERDWGRVADG